MSLIDKAYFTLEEIEERWQLPHRDVVYLTENGLLKLSVRLFSVRLEWGEFEDLGNGDWNRIPTDQRWFSGLQDLREHDAFRLFRDGETQIDQFAMPEHHYCHLFDPTESLLIRASDVVVQRRSGTGSSSSTGLPVPPGRPSPRSSGRSATTARSMSRAGSSTSATFSRGWSSSCTGPRSPAIPGAAARRCWPALARPARALRISSNRSGTGGS